MDDPFGDGFLKHGDSPDKAFSGLLRGVVFDIGPYPFDDVLELGFVGHVSQSAHFTLSRPFYR